jgi:hypothetical protein
MKTFFALPLVCGILSAATCLAQNSAVPVPTFDPSGRPAPVQQPPAVQQPVQAAPRPTATPTPRPSGPLLSDLEKMLNTGAEPLSVNLVFPDADEITESHLIRGAAVAQAIALRAGDRPVIFSHSRQPANKAFNVLIGSTDALSFYVPAAVVQQTSHALLYVQPFAGTLPLLVVSGVTPAGVDDAILALGFVNQKLPETNVAYIRAIQLPATPPFMRRAPLFPAMTQTFAELQKGGDALSLAQDGGINMKLFMSAMVAGKTEAKLQMDLHFFLRQRAFSSASGISIVLNGEPVAALAASDISAAATGGSASVVEIPINSFLPGRNDLLFQPAGMMGQYATPDTFSIYGDSSVVFPRMDAKISLPDLFITSRTMFPLIGQPDGSEISILVTASDPDTVHAAWTFLGKAAQMANTLLYSASVSYTTLNQRQHQIIIGPLETLPKEYRSGITEKWLKSTGQKQAETANLQPREPEKNLQFFLSEQAAKIRPTPQPTATPDAEGEHIVSDAYSAYFSSVANPATTGKWALILSAIDGPTLEKRTTELVQPAFWSRLKGSAALWSSDPAKMHLFLPGVGAKQSAFDDRDVQLPLGERLSRNVWAILGAVLFIILVSLTMSLLKQFDQAVQTRKRTPANLPNDQQ